MTSPSAIAGSVASSPTRTHEQETLEALARQARSVPVPVAIAMLVVASAAYDRLPLAAIGTWYAAVLLMLAVRWVVLPRLAADTTRPELSRLRTATVLSGVNASIHASSLLAFPWLDAGARTVITLLLTGLSTGTVVSSAGWRPVFHAYAGTVMLALGVAWLVVPSPEIGLWPRIGVTVLTAFFYRLLRQVAGDLSSALAETFAIRHREVGLRADLVDANTRLHVALDQARSANHAKTRFLASASHDLRQPLHALLLFTAALSVRKLDPKSQEIAARIDDATQALAHELDTLLDVSKLDAGVVQVHRETLDAADVVGRTVAVLAPVAQRKGLALELDVEAGVSIESDRTLLDRVLRNLLDNAIKYTDAGRVAIGARRVAGGGVAFTVVDTGRGIAAHERERIFEEFYQIDNPERDRERGLGLGLAIVRRLVALLGGRLELESAPGRGASFTLTLRETLETAVATSPTPEIGRTVDLTGLRVLVVDDESSVRVGMRLLLEGFGCRVSTATGTVEALALQAGSDGFDIVLADLRLRGDDSGLHAIDALRGSQPALPALLVSGDTAPDRLRDAHRAGLGLLHKPVPVEVLATAIARALRDVRRDRPRDRTEAA